MNNFKNKIIKFIQLLNIMINFLTKNTFDEIKLIKKLRNNSVIFDIGSNQGSFIHLIKKYNKNKVFEFHSFEPIKNLVEKQKKIFEKTKHKFIANNLAVSQEKDKAKFYLREINSQSSLINNHFLNSSLRTEEIEVETITLDQYCKLKNVNWIDLLKIDTEGLDLEVLRSGESLIKSGSIEYIKIEINCSDNNLAEIVNYMTEFNYALIGTLNTKYIKNKLTIFDAYFQKL